MDYSSGIFAVSRPSKTVIRRKSTCGINTCCVGGCLKQHFLLFNRLGRWTTGRRLFTVYWLHSVFLRSNFRTWQCIHDVSMIQMNITPELVNKKSIFSSENQHVWPRKSLCTEYLQSHFLSLKTIISSRLPSNKINNYVKNVPIWT